MENERMVKNKYLFSKWVSYIFEAPFLAIPTFIILNLILDMNNFLIIETICLLFATIIPVLVLLLWRKTKGVDINFTIKESRNYPLLIATLIYFLGTFILWLFSANPLIMAVMFCYGSNTLIVFFINLKWKISIHSMGVTGPTIALLFINPWFFILGLIGPLVMWSRLVLKKHTVSQVLVGSLLGYLLTAIQLYFLTKLMHFNVNVEFYLILLIITGLTLPSLLLSLKSYLDNNHFYDRYVSKILYFLVFGLFFVFLSFFSFIPSIALILSGSISIVIEYFETHVFHG
ncbi:MAG: phosphatase PAP2 family protein [Methanobacteriaceae archaeon]|jgi:membrane-associated phospholipid phosphatase|nr:phosphatase PAP2 family protein [Candidatus Methanorudis spinitermitis]